MKTRIQNVRLVQDGQIRPVTVLIDGEKIAAVLPAGAAPEADAVMDGGGRYLSHGFLDIHTHGGGGHDFMDATEEAYLGAAKLHAAHGTTGLAVTTLAASKEEILDSFAVYEGAKSKSQGARLLGVHLEGPYLSPAQSGAQDPRYIRAPKREEYEEIVAACPDILRWTIAPEIPGALELADFLRERGILPSMGHTDATYDQVKEALAHGFTHVTHLYSATSTIVRIKGYRYPGVLESAYLLDDLTVEIIADGCHLPAPLLQMVYRFIGPRRTALITDSMRGAGMPEGGKHPGQPEKRPAGPHRGRRGPAPGPQRLCRQRGHHGPAGPEHGGAGRGLPPRCRGNGHGDSRPHPWEKRYPGPGGSRPERGPGSL